MDKEWGGIILSILHTEMIDEIDKVLKNNLHPNTILFDLKTVFKDLKSDFSL